MELPIVGRRDPLGGAAGRRDLAEPPAGERREDDGVVRSPAGPVQGAGVAGDWFRQSAGQRDPKQGGLGREVEPHPSAIRGKERRLATLGAQYRHRVDAGQVASIERLAQTRVDAEDDRLAIGRDGEATRCALSQTHLLHAKRQRESSELAARALGTACPPADGIGQPQRQGRDDGRPARVRDVLVVMLWSRPRCGARGGLSPGSALFGRRRRAAGARAGPG